MNLNHALSARSDFSIGESMLQMDHLVADAKEKGYESVALVDTMSIHGMVDFSNKCKKAGIKPIFGCRIRVVKDPRYRKPLKVTGIKEIENPSFYIKAYVLNEAGIKSIIKLLSKASSEEYFYYHTRVGLEDVLELEGVAITTGDFFNVWQLDDAKEIVKKISDKLPTFVEFVPIDTPLFDTLNAKALEYMSKAENETIISYPMLYRQPEHAETLSVLNCITFNTQMNAPWRRIQHVGDFYIQESSHLIERAKSTARRVKKWNDSENYSHIIKGLAGVDKLANMCEYSFESWPVSLPKLAEDEYVALTKKCVEGWSKRLKTEVLGYMPPEDKLPEYKARLMYELAVLRDMGFSGYFLLVEDLVSWAKDNGVMVGPGRGSSSGSLVAYLTGITDIDPIRFNLIFERFINPDRLDLPDADLDFVSSKRHLVVEYLTEKYGSDRVAGISNYSSLASASALRDVGRVFGLSALDLVSTKLVPKEHGQPVTLTEAAKQVPEIDRFKSEQKEVWGHAVSLEGVMRSFGRHAAGVVIAGEPLVERAVVETRLGSPVVNWDKRTVELWGLVKVDILGLSTLDILEIAKGYIKEGHGVDLDYLKIPLDDEKMLEAFGKGQTTGVFQFSSRGMAKLLQDLAENEPLTFEDVATATALYRPGPMDSGLMADYVAIKQGKRSATYDHPSMIDALKSTHGVIVYQEQVMQVARDLAGFTMADADKLRKVMGKKQKEEMAEMRQKWIDGCAVSSGMDAKNAGSIFDKVESFAGYGFNKSHAFSYTVISCWTMWLRVNYPAEYFAACLSIADEEKLPELVKDARSLGIEVLPPDINKSGSRYSVLDNKRILAPFSSVKGISENTALSIMLLRERNAEWAVVRVIKKRDGSREEVWGRVEGSAVKGVFDSIQEFSYAAAESGSKVSSKVVECLSLVGAFANIDPSQRPALDTSRRRDQVGLMPGLMIDSVKADRSTDFTEPFLRAKVVTLIQDYKSCKDCSLANSPHPSVRAKKDIKFMVITDSPTWQEEKEGRLLEGDASEFVKLAIKNAGLSAGNGYYTTLVKAKKIDKFLSNDQINACAKHLDRELELIKPAVIIALGTASIKRFLPGMKGSATELSGKVVYSAGLDASIVCGINPQQLAFDTSKFGQLEESFKRVAEILI